MTKPSAQLGRLAAVVLTSMAASGAVHAQQAEPVGAYPSRPVRMIVPFAPGGASDFIGRIRQPKLG